MVRLNQVTNKNVGKVIYALFLMTIIESLCTAVFITPAMMLFQREEFTMQTRIVSLVLLFAATIVYLTFQFGFAIMLLRLVRNEKSNLGYIFMGFRRFNYAGKIIFAFGVILGIIALVVRFIAKTVSVALFNSMVEMEIPTDEGTQAILQLGAFAAIFFLLSFIVLIHFAFVFHLHFDNPKLGVMELFKRSAVMMNKKVFKLIGFALRAGGRNLLIAIVFALLVTFMPGDKEKGSLSILTFLFDLVYFINLYTALVKFYFTVPVMYEAILHPPIEIEIILEPEETEQNESSN
ncbi:MAG: hypothetical protein KBT11_09940 [Treponema sp.]|nr:hypothetical protein [Candidatus Treponema equifaecale]